MERDQTPRGSKWFRHKTSPNGKVSLAPVGDLSILNHMDNNLHIRFQAMGDPTRLAVIERLLKGPASVSDLAAPFDMALPAFTKHLGVLERAGLVTSEKTGRVRTCRVNPAALSEIDRWLTDRRALWTARLDGLDAYLNANRKD